MSCESHLTSALGVSQYATKLLNTFVQLPSARTILLNPTISLPLSHDRFSNQLLICFQLFIMLIRLSPLKYYII